MKKYFFLTILVTALVILSCSKPEEDIIIPPIELDPTVELTISPNDAVLPYGKDITVTWNITNFKTATLNGVAINTATGSREFKQLLITTDFTVVATNFTKSVTNKKTVTVGDWKSSRFGLLTHNQKHWVLNRYEFFQNGVLWAYIPPGGNEIGRYFIYYTDGTCKQFDRNNVVINDMKWELQANDTKLYWQGAVYAWDIFNLTESELSFAEDIVVDGVPSKLVRTWRIRE